MIEAEFVPGVHDGMPADAYHAVEALSASGAKKLLRSPAHYLLERTQSTSPTEAMRIGTAVHTLLLEPHRAGEIVEMPAFNRRSAAGKAEAEAWLAENAGRQAFDAETIANIHAAAEAVRAHAGAAALLSDGKPEVSMLWTDGQYGIRCKSRYDWLRDDGGIVDLKTAQDASPDGFGRSAAKFLYHAQAAMYCYASEALLDRSPAFFAFVVVEPAPPYGVAAYVMQSDAIRAGQRLIDRAMRTYRECLDSGRWPGYPETIEPLKFPKWALTFPNE